MKDSQELASCHLSPDRFGGLKDFTDKAEMDGFTANAEEEGSRLMAWAERSV